MKLKLPFPFYLTVYFLLMLLLYHFLVKHYFYWEYIAILKEEKFGFSLSRLAVSIGFFFLNLISIRHIYKNRLGFMVVFTLFALSTLPSLVAYTSGPIYPLNALLSHQILFYAIYVLSFVKVDFSRIPVLNKRQSLYLLFLITTIGVVPYLLVYGPYIDLKNLFLIDVYKTRAATRGLSNAYFGYTYSLFTKIIIPLIIILSIEQKNRLLLVGGIAYLTLFYLFGAHKTAYLGILVVLAFYSFNYLKAANWILFLSIILIIGCFLLAFFGYDYPWILTFRRVHFLPTLLDIGYLDFFQDNFMYWSESVLSGIFEYPYDERHEFLIGEYYFNRPDMAANNGLVSDGYMNLGFYGVFLHSIVIGAYFMLLNSLNIPSRYYGLFFLTIFSFISSSIFTVFLTHGAFALLLISIFLLRERND